MKDNIKHWIIIGSSRGLGAALVEALLCQTSASIIGIARTHAADIPNYERWAASRRYRHIQLDIASSQSRSVLKSCVQTLSPAPLGVIFNAAQIETDVNTDQTLNYEIFDQVNRVGINGLGNVLFGFEEHLLQHGGIVIGISSFSAYAPPLFSKVAYPSTKVYLDMLFRCLRTAWPESIRFVTVHLGHIGNWKNVFSRWSVPTYSKAAMKIVRSISRQHIPSEINYPLIYSIVYKYILAFFPDSLYLWGLRTFVNYRHILKQKRS